MFRRINQAQVQTRRAAIHGAEATLCHEAPAPRAKGPRFRDNFPGVPVNSRGEFCQRTVSPRTASDSPALATGPADRLPTRRSGTGSPPARQARDAASRFAAALLLLALALTAPAQPFQLPTANRALFEPGGEERFLVGTAGKPWTSGGFGCVRSEGNQMHEGLDIRCLQRSRRGEPTDPILATAAGTVAYINPKGGLSNYGKYVVVCHRVEGIEVYSLYAHLSEVRPDLRVGMTVRAGEPIAVMGTTSNTRERITKDRAHVHFELNLMVNDRFGLWFKQTHPGERNDHGTYNGHNLLGLDPRLLLLQQQSQGARFSLLQFLRGQPELCRVLVRGVHYPWLSRYAALIVPNPRLGAQPPAGYELVLNYNGVPCQMIPRSAAELGGAGKYHLLSVNAAEAQRNGCRRLVMQHGNTWLLSTHGQELLEMLTY